MKITDDKSGIRDAAVYYTKPVTKNQMYVLLKYNAKTEMYEGTITVNNNHQSGEYLIEYIYLTDNNNNSKSYNNSKNTKVYTGSSNRVDLSRGNFTVYTTIPPSELYEDEISVSTDRVTDGDTIDISVVAADTFGIKSVQVTYIQPDTNEDYVLDMDLKDGQYCKTLSFERYGYNGIWRIKKIDIVNSRDITTTFYNNKVDNINGTVDLSGGDFETYGLTDDITKPELVDFSLDKNSLIYGQSSNIIVNTTDDKSGIANVYINYTLPNNTTKNYYLSEEEDKFTYEFIFNSSKEVGNYTANYIAIEDNAGNILRVEENISDLDIKLIGQIHIITPSKYLELTKSYKLEAIIYPTSETITGVTWQSSNTQIATINSTTGYLSTMGKEGNVTITATANDGSGMKATIDLVVSGTSVKVGNKISVGNSSYTTYDEVDWVVEDESIIRKTGHYGKISINNQHKHSVEIEGLKPGTTKIYMCMLSGSVIASSNVLVYDAIDKIECDKEELNLIIGESENLNISITPSTLDINEEIFYISENDNIATVDTNGNVTAIEEGNTNIHVYAKNNSDIQLTVPVHIAKEHIEPEILIEVKCDKEELNLIIGESENLNISITPNTLDISEEIFYISENDNIATVDTNGNVTAIEEGNTNIHVYAKNNSDIQLTIPVHVTKEHVEPEIELGDVDRNGVVNSTDCTLILRYLKGYEQLDEEQLIIADVDKNGTVNSTDCTKILRYLKGYEEI